MAEAIPKPGAISFEDRARKARPYEWGFGSTPRIAKLRDDTYSKAVVIKDWGEVISGLGIVTFRKNVKLDVDRARIVTKVYKETEGQPAVLRKAKVCQALCEEMPIFIKPGELIVGDANSAPDEVRWYPEVSVSYIPHALETGFKHMLTEEEKKEVLEDIYEYWKDKCQEALVRAVLPEEVQAYTDRSMSNPCFYANHWNSGRHIIGYDYEKLFKEGINARIKRVEAKLKELESKALEMNPAEYIQKKNTWQAMIVSAKALLRFAKRHAELAREQAQNEQDPARKKELEEIAAVCDWVPANPPRTFHEVLQFFWFIEVVGRYMVGPGNGSGCRLDQVWWPYYEADMKEGRITRARALELIEGWMLKVQETGAAAENPQLFTLTSGGEVFYTANIGGSVD